ncbi:hypothetical protein N7456_006347 [Penicillium angulare]|uniref:Aminoglycoside phosphotransferase domain-containing protein n=1 Tax=Penicillium angulare TaxID=116970 RepID=A0A9W9FHH4_9EURO|nr:hypothetical protein N7456_006347 [Penicillium angulare]
MQLFDIDAIDDEALVELCHQAEKKGGMIEGHLHGNRIIKISDQVAVKYGLVQESEAKTQEFAFNHVDRGVVHIPKVYRYIKSRQSGYLQGYIFMDCIQGQNLKDVDLDLHPDIPLLQHGSQAQLGIATPSGYIYGDDGARQSFNSIEDMNGYMNKRIDHINAHMKGNLKLDLQHDSIDLTPYPLVLCHGNPARRNMILKSDGSIALVDWGYSGFYPRFFELAILTCCLPWDKPFGKPVISELERLLSLSDQEMQYMKLTTYVRGANLKWSLDSCEPERDPLEEHLQYIQSTDPKRYEKLMADRMARAPTTTAT